MWTSLRRFFFVGWLVEKGGSKRWIEGEGGQEGWEKGVFCFFFGVLEVSYVSNIGFLRSNLCFVHWVCACRTTTSALM